MRQSVPDEATCAICGRHFDPSDTRGWCPNPSCGEWRHPSFPIEEEAEDTSGAGSSPSQRDSDRPTKPCPHCGEEVREDARFCKHCVSPIDEGDEAAAAAEAEEKEVNSLIEECPDCGADLSGIPEDRLSTCPICMFDLTPVVEAEGGSVEQEIADADEPAPEPPVEDPPAEAEPPDSMSEEPVDQPPDQPAPGETPPPEETQEPDVQPPGDEPPADSPPAPPDDPAQPPPAESPQDHHQGVDNTDPVGTPQEEPASQHPPQGQPPQQDQGVAPDQGQQPPPQDHGQQPPGTQGQPPAGGQGQPPQNQPPQSQGPPPGQAPPQDGQPPAAPTSCPNCGEDLTPIPPDMRTVCPGCRVDLDEGEAMSVEREQEEEPDVDPTKPLDTMDEIAAGYLQRLSDAGIETIGELVRQDPDDLAATTGVSSRRIQGWIEDAPLDPQDVENIPEPVAADDDADDSETVIQPSGPGDLYLDVMGTELHIEDGEAVGKNVRSAMVDAGAPEEDAVYVHRKHVRFDVKNNAWVLTRLGQNSLAVNGQDVEKGDQVQITDGDEIDFSDVVTTQVDIR